MLRSYGVVILIVLAVSALLPASALAGGVIQNVPPSPGTVEDSSRPIKLIADGPPRPLIQMPQQTAPLLVAAVATNQTH